VLIIDPRPGAYKSTFDQEIEFINAINYLYIYVVRNPLKTKTINVAIMKNQLKKLFGLLLVLLIAIIGCNQKDSSSELMSQVDKYLTFWNTGNFDGIENILCEDFEIRVSPLYEPEKGIEAFKESVLSTRESYPDFKITIDESFHIDDNLAGRWTVQATSKTGKRLIIPGMSILHFVDGKIKDEWISNNDLLWLEQLDYSIKPPETELK